MQLGSHPNEALKFLPLFPSTRILSATYPSFKIIVYIYNFHKKRIFVHKSLSALVKEKLINSLMQ